MTHSARRWILVALLLVSLGQFGGTASAQQPAPDKGAPTRGRDKQGVDLPQDDPLFQAIQKRFGRPDRLTGSGRAFIHYDLSNGDTLTLVVSGDRVLGAMYETKQSDVEDALFALPPREVDAGMFDKWQRESAKDPPKANVRYTRVECDRKPFWVAEAQFGYGDPAKKIAVYAPTKDGMFRRCLLFGPLRAGWLAVAVDAKTGNLELREQANGNRPGEVVLSFNLKTVGVLP